MLLDKQFVALLGFDRLHERFCKALNGLLIHLELPVLHHFKFDVDDLDDPIEEQMIVEVEALIQVVVTLNLLNLGDRLLDLE